MVATYEENIAKLKQQDNWWSFTDSQRVFLDGVAKGLKPLDAIKQAYPDCKNAVTLTKHMLERVGIQRALDTIGIDVRKANLSKADALQMLTRRLHKAGTDDATFAKLLSLYAKLAGWDKEEDDPSEEVSLDKLIVAMEKKRKGKV
jgi:hypothetical protein